MPLPGLSDTIAKAQRIVLLLAAADVTLLRVKVPTLSAARLKAALPNLVEDQLIADPSECTVVAGSMKDGLRTVAVAQRAWLEALDKTLTALGARQISALPAQLCLPYQVDQPGTITAAVNRLGDTVDIAFRLSEHDGIGLAISAGQNGSAAHEVIQALCAVVPEASIALYVPQSETSPFQEAVNEGSAPDKHISILTDSWSHWISGASGTTLDLIAGLGSRSVSKLELRTWRWPLALAATVLFVNISALNIDWWRMKAEASSLRANMIKIYKSAFPKETVIIDPVAQMQQKIATARNSAGLVAPDDFIAVMAAFSEAWASAGTASGKLPAIAALEYHERSLTVRLKPFPGSDGTRDANSRDSEALAQKMKAALAERNLSLEQTHSESATVWKIRSVK